MSYPRCIDSLVQSSCDVGTLLARFFKFARRVRPSHAYLDDPPLALLAAFARVVKPLLG